MMCLSRRRFAILKINRVWKRNTQSKIVSKGYSRDEAEQAEPQASGTNEDAVWEESHVICKVTKAGATYQRE